MVTGWRRAFCTSIRKEDRDTKISSEMQPQSRTQSSSPRISSKLGFFSTPSTPRLRSQPVSGPRLQCRTATADLKLQRKTAAATSTPKKRSSSSTTTSSSNTFHTSSSHPSSPKSPSSFSFLRASLRIFRTRCGICLHSVKTGQGTAIFTAECSHTFHFPCIAANVKKNRTLACPVCNATWKELPLLDHSNSSPKMQSSPRSDLNAAKVVDTNPKPLRVYDDDESLLSPSSVSRFNTIPESDESNEDRQHEEPVDFPGFFAGTADSPLPSMSKSSRSNVEISLLQEAAVVSVNKSYGTYAAVVLKVKAPAAEPNGTAPRVPVDLVTVLDVSSCMNDDKVHAMKRAMRLVISSLSDADRLSIIAFSATSKRLLPLRRMNVLGRRSARRIINAIGRTGQPASVNDALKKAAKVLEDRREKNTFAAVVLLSDGHDQRLHGSATDRKRSYPVVTSSRLGHVPIHAVGFGDCDQAAQEEEAFGKRLVGLLSVAVQDLRLQLGFVAGSDPGEITAVYSLIGRPSALGSGLIRVGDLYADEERELLVELKVRDFSTGSHYMMSVGSSYREPPSQELVYSEEQPIPVPWPQPVRSPSTRRLKNLHITARAIAESQRLIKRRDLSGACRRLSSARALLVQSGLESGDELRRRLEAELAEMQRLRRAAERQRTGHRDGPQAAEKPEPLTTTSAWRAAERLAKVAIMRKSMNRVSDLHGFEDARF